VEPLWRGVSPGDAEGLAELDRAVKRADGDETISDLVGAALSADAAVCVSAPAGAIIAAGYVKGAMLGGRVRPHHRRRGLGNRLLEWAEEHAPAGDAELTIRNEALTADAHTIYLSHGFEPEMVENRMVRELALPVPDAPLPAGVEALPWNRKSAAQFFAAYRASFADRPGFPWTGQPAEEWIGDLYDEAFRPDLSVVALVGGEPVGFVTVAQEPPAGWIYQIGVAPAWRRQGLGAALLAETLRAFQAEGLVEARLHVNVNNPGATAVYERLGFAQDLQRARYVKRR
jgi:mycothiol synthase